MGVLDERKFSNGTAVTAKVQRHKPYQVICLR